MKMPPIEKVHEALTAIADNRITIDNDNNIATVISSDNNKKYTVDWKDNIYSSNDNATYWQGYPGYPIIATLLMQSKINYNNEVLKYLKNINWKDLNTKFKNNYKEVVKYVYNDIEKEGIDLIDNEVNIIYKALEKIDIIIRKSKYAPPK